MINSKLIGGAIIAVVLAIGGIFFINNKNNAPTTKEATAKADIKNDSSANQKNTQPSTQTQKQVSNVGAVVSGTIVDEEGKPASVIYYKPNADSTYSDIPIISLTDTATGKSEMMLECPYEKAAICPLYEDPASGKIKFNNRILPGHYLLKATIPVGYYRAGEVILGSKEFDVSAGQEKVDLGNITLSGIKASY